MFEDLPQLTAHVTVESPTQIFFKQTINLCAWMEDPLTVYFAAIFGTFFEKRYDPKLVICPVEKGVYVVAEPGEYLTNIESFLPAFIPMRGNLTARSKLETKIASRVEPVITITESIAFV